MSGNMNMKKTTNENGIVVFENLGSTATQSTTYELEIDGVTTTVDLFGTENKSIIIII